MSPYNNPDQFFISGGDPNVLIAIMEEMRASLLKLNRWNPSNSATILDTEQLARLARLKYIAYNYKTEHKYRMNRYDIDQAAFVQQMIEVGDAVIDYNKAEMKEVNSYISQVLANKDNIEKIFYQIEMDMQSEKSNSEKIGDLNYNIAKNTDPDSGVHYGYTGSYILPGGQFENVSDNFPIHGEEWDNPTKHITDQMNETIIMFGTFNNGKGPKEEIPKSWQVKDKSGLWVPDPIRTFTPENPFSRQLGDRILAQHAESSSKNPPGTVKFFIEKLHGRDGKGLPFKKGKLISQKTVLGQENFSNRMVFAAYIDNFNDQYQSNYNQYNFIGRGEEVPIYKNTTRTFTFTFSIIADYSIDLMAAMEKIYSKLDYDYVDDNKLKQVLEDRQDWGLGYIGLPQPSEENKRYGGHIPGMYSDTPESLWHKLTFLAQCMYPYYRTDGKMKEQPMTRVRIGDFYDVTGYIQNYQLDMSEFDNTIDLNPSAIGNIPFAVKVTINMGIIHDNEPSSEFFGFYNRLEYDENTADSSTGLGLAKESMSVTKEGTTKASPIQHKTIQDADGFLDTPAYLQRGMEDLKRDLELFKINFKEFTGIGINVPEKVRKEKAEKAMKSYVRVNQVADQVAPFYGLEPTGSINEIAGNNVKGNFNEQIGGNKNNKENFITKLKDRKEKFDILYGNARAIVNDIGRPIEQTNRRLKRAGINIEQFDDIQNVVDKVNGVKPRRKELKTIGDISRRLDI